MKHQRKFIITALSLILCLVTSIGVALAYFTDYEDARGGAVIRLGGQTELTEDVDADGNKSISIQNTGETDMIVKVYVICDVTDESGKSVLTVSGDGWTQGSDGAWYYNKILKPGNDGAGDKTGVLSAEVNVKGSKTIDFDVIVAHESSRVVYEVKDNANVLQVPDGWDAARVAEISIA